MPYVITIFSPIFIRKLDQTKQNFRVPFVEGLVKDSGGPSLHPRQWGESNVLITQSLGLITQSLVWV